MAFIEFQKCAPLELFTSAESFNILFQVVLRDHVSINKSVALYKDAMALALVFRRNV